MTPIKQVKADMLADPEWWLIPFMDFVDEFRRDRDLSILQEPLEGDHGNQHTGGKVAKAQSCALAKSAEQTAQTLGISARKVEQARTVMDHGDEGTKQAIEKNDPDQTNETRYAG